MSEHIFAYFGPGKFENFDNVLLESSNIASANEHYFSKLKTSSVAVIQDVYLAWSHLLVKAAEEIVRIDFWKNDCIRHPEQLFPSLKDIEIYDVVCGLSNSFIATESGLYYFSQNTNFHPELIKCALEHKIIKVAVEDLNALAVTKDGKVFNINLEEKLSLQPLCFPVAIKEVACGKEHVLLLASCGTIFSYGSGSRGQLGHGNIENLKEPTVIEALDGLEFTAVAAGGWHSAAISSAGDLYMWGWNESGQLGLPCAEIQGDKRPVEEIETVCCLPKIIELADETVKYVGCGSRHTAALTEVHHLWTWGWNAYGQLGHKKALLNDTPEKVDLPEHFQPFALKCRFWSTLIIGNG